MEGTGAERLEENPMGGGSGSARSSHFPSLHPSHPWLLVVLVLYLILALTYSLIVPIFEAPDEPAHFLYANDLAAGDGLPVLDYSKSPWEYHQPPLYYGLVAGVLRWFHTTGYKQFTLRNPHAAISDASTTGNKNVYLHDPELQGWPFRGLSLAIHAGRLVSIGLGVMTVWATYGLALKVFSTKGIEAASVTWMAAAAAAVVALNPQFLFISSVLNNDNAVTALCSLALWAAATYYDRPRSARWLVALGGLSGLAALTKTTGLAVIALVIGVLIAKAMKQRLVNKLWLDAGLVALLAAAIGSWWYVRNALLYADPFLSRYLSRWVGGEAAPTAAIEILRRFEQGEISFWGTFGWLNIAWPEWVYRLLRTWTRLSGLGLVILGIRWLLHKSPLRIGERPRIAVLPLVIVLAWTSLVAAMLTQWILVAGGLQGRLLFPAISALAILLVAGWTNLAPHRLRPITAAIPVIGLACLAILTPFTTIAPAYARPQALTSAKLPADATHTDLTYADRVRLLGYQVTPPVAHPGERVDVTLYWQMLESVSTDFSVFVHVFGRDRQLIASIDTYPGLGNFPTSQWQARDIIRDVYPMRIDPDATSPTLATISVGWYDFYGSREGIPAMDRAGNPTTTIGRLKMTPREWIRPEPQQEIQANYDNTFTLLGYDLQLAKDSTQLDLSLYWRCDASPSVDYTMFAHLVDSDNNMMSQMDRPPLGGDYPTSYWEPGEVVQDNLLLPLPSMKDFKEKSSAGKLLLQIGIYHPGDGTRLPVLDTDGQVMADAVISPVTLKLPK